MARAVQETGFSGKMVLLTNTDYSDFYASALITKEILESLGAEVDFQVSDWRRSFPARKGERS